MLQKFLCLKPFFLYSGGYRDDRRGGGGGGRGQYGGYQEDRNNDGYRGERRDQPLRDLKLVWFCTFVFFTYAHIR